MNWYDRISVRERDGWLSSNVAILAGKEWGVSSCKAALAIAFATAKEMKEAGFEEITFTLRGQKDPVWRMKL